MKTHNNNNPREHKKIINYRLCQLLKLSHLLSWVLILLLVICIEICSLWLAKAQEIGTQVSY